MNRTEINRVALWQAKPVDQLTINRIGAGRVYYRDNIAVTSEDPLYRYAKNFIKETKDGAVKFCLFIITPLKDKKRLEDFLNAAAEKVQEQQAVEANEDDDFAYLDYYFKLAEGEENE